MKPKPLNLDSEEIEELIAHKLKNLDTVIINVDEVPDIRTAIRVTTEEIKQRINFACEFYRKYRDNPELLAKEHPELECKIRPKKYYLWYWFDAYKMKKYSDWLFKLAFKEVLKNEK